MVLKYTLLFLLLFYDASFFSRIVFVIIDNDTSNIKYTLCFLCSRFKENQLKCVLKQREIDYKITNMMTIILSSSELKYINKKK